MQSNVTVFVFCNKLCVNCQKMFVRSGVGVCKCLQMVVMLFKLL